MSVLRIGKTAPSNQSLLDSLLILGYEEAHAKKALACNPSVETAVDWIERHRDELEAEATQPQKTPSATLTLPVEKMNSANAPLKVEAPKPTTNPSTKPVLPSQQDTDEEAEKHKEFLQRQAQKLAAQQKREREAQRLHEERLRLQLEEDRLAREAKYNSGADKSKTDAGVTKTPSQNKPIAPSASSAKDCTVQVKLLNGTVTTLVFQADESVLELHNYIASLMDCDVNFTFVTPYPKKELSATELTKTFIDLGLCPKASLLVLEKKEEKK